MAQATALKMPHAHHKSYLEEGGFWTWLVTLDHKRIGIMYLAAAMFFLAVGGVFAMLIRTELAFPGQTIMGPDTYNKVFTLHVAIMIFMFLFPVIPAGLGNFFIPIMLRAKDV